MIGRTISHYRILEKLGGGGMGVVYKAEDTKLRRTVALKFLPPDLTRDEHSKGRFVREAQAASGLDHPNICTIHHIDETPDGQIFICMAFYEGETLKKTIERGTMSVEEALDTGIKIARGLAKAHSEGIVHRDIKPANVMMTNEGEVKVVDFGLAKLTGTTKVTRTGTTLGTVAYMSPEQAKSEKVDERSDVFSLGVVLYELLTGRLPFDGDTEAAVVYGIMCRDPVPLTKYRNDTTPELQRVITKALRKDVPRRYQTAAELEEDLQRVLDGSSPILPGRLRPYRSRRFTVPVLITLSALLALLVIPQSRQVINGLFRDTSAEKQIVVLPFENVGDDPSNQAFCDGLMETLTSQLTQLEQFHGSLWVVPASEVRKRGIESPSEAHRVFGVNLVVSGGVQQFSGRFRVTLNLIGVADPDRPRQLNSTVIDDRLANVSVLQDETVVKMADLLNVELIPETRLVLAAGGTGVSAAYELYLKGRGYLQRYEKQGNIDEAIRSFEHAIEQDSLYALAYAGLGEAYWQKYRVSMDPMWVGPAVENCERASELDESLSPVHVTLGVIHTGTGDSEKGIQEFQRALELDPASAAALRGLGTAYGDAGRLEEAEATYRKSIEIKPDYWGGHYDLGVFYWRHDRLDDAVTQFRRVVAITPDNMWGYNSLGAAYYNLGRWEEAHGMFERSIAAQPNYRAYSNLGTLDYMNGRYADAAAMYEKALELNDTSYKTWANLANAYYWMPDKRDEANEIYRRTAEMAEEQLNVNPEDERLLTSLAGYHAMVGGEERAVTLIEKALTLAPNDSRVIYFAGHTYEQLGDREKALELIGRALEIGYPAAEVENDPWLSNLRSDDRFQQLLQGARDKNDG